MRRGWSTANRSSRPSRAVLHQAASLSTDKAEEARVWIAYTAAAVADDELAQLHREHNRAFLDRITRLLAAARPELDTAARGHAAIRLVALVEGLNTLAALDPATYDATTQTAVIDQALTHDEP